MLSWVAKTLTALLLWNAKRTFVVEDTFQGLFIRGTPIVIAQDIRIQFIQAIPAIRDIIRVLVTQADIARAFPDMADILVLYTEAEAFLATVAAVTQVTQVVDTLVVGATVADIVSSTLQTQI